MQTGVTVFRMMNVLKGVGRSDGLRLWSDIHDALNAEESIESIKLDDMPYAFGARFQLEKGCLPGTRELFLQEIREILNNPDDDAPRVCLLTGVAGSGKSAVAHSIARWYSEQQRLGSSYCFASTDMANRNPKNLFTTIARDLCDHDVEYKAALWQVVKDDRSLRTSQSPLEQIETLIVKPCKDLHPVGPLVVVIDALDESGNPTSRQHILQAISKHITENSLPKHLRFLITARPEDDILAELPTGPRVIHKYMGDVASEVVDEDIRKFIHHALHRYSELESCWPGQEWCRLLVRHSQNLFQWASAACNFIRGLGDAAEELDVNDRFEIVVQAGNNEGVHPLDKLYRTILEQRFANNNAQSRFREVMAIVLALREPLPLTSLSALFADRLKVANIIRRLASLLDGVLDEERPIRPLHTSFRDFLLDDTRSSTFHISIQPHHHLCLGQALLACMRKMLRFNICNLKDSRTPNAAIPDLPNRITKAIPPHLSYSCLYWMDHLRHPDCTPVLLNEVTLFIKDKFPYWLEAISILSLSSPTTSILSATETCITLRKWAKVRLDVIISGEC